MNKLKRIVRHIANAVEYPELVKAHFNKLDKDFVQNLCFLKDKLNIRPNTILDIGAAVGEWSKAASYVFPESSIYAFEPIPAAFQKLQELKKINKKFSPFNYALSSKSGRTNFYLNDFFYSSSLLKMTDEGKEIFDFLKNERLIEVECRKLEELDDIQYKSPIFLKLDVQGAELTVLEGAGSILNKTDVIQLELNFDRFYQDQANYEDIIHFLNEKKFKYFFQTSQFYKNNTISFCDLIFWK